MVETTSDSDLRFNALDQITRDYFESIYQQERSLYLQMEYDSAKLRSAVDAYYTNLSRWKSYFNVPDRLDQHKVAAITMHYLLMYRPVALKKRQPRPAILLFANEMLAWHIALSRLEDNGHLIKPSSFAFASYIRLARDHMHFLSSESYATYEGHALRHWSVFMYLIERNNLLESRFDK